ncbi:hypothetical protein SynSYN20_00127 [Synechococcus sp. SYN20]|nr:hypothetical protein SynSYN20_00127 [Synechococcus sp. SYN20]
MRPLQQVVRCRVRWQRGALDSAIRVHWLAVQAALLGRLERKLDPL